MLHRLDSQPRPLLPDTKDLLYFVGFETNAEKYDPVFVQKLVASAGFAGAQVPNLPPMYVNVGAHDARVRKGDTH